MQDCSFVKIANLPKNELSTVIISSEIDSSIENSLKKIGINLIKNTGNAMLYEAVRTHSDLRFCHIGKNIIVHEPEVEVEILKKLKDRGFKTLIGNAKIGNKYPQNIAYNVAIVGKYAFHNAKYTDVTIKVELEKRNIELIHVKQGYTKCMVAVVDENSIITEDKGIAKVAKSKNIDVLLLEREENIKLKGMNKGFIGGASFVLNSQTFCVIGNPKKLQNHEIIREFLCSKGMDFKGVGDCEVTDIGSVITLIEN